METPGCLAPHSPAPPGAPRCRGRSARLQKAFGCRGHSSRPRLLCTEAATKAAPAETSMPSKASLRKFQNHSISFASPKGGKVSCYAKNMYIEPDFCVSHPSNVSSRDQGKSVLQVEPDRSCERARRPCCRRRDTGRRGPSQRRTTCEQDPRA